MQFVSLAATEGELSLAHRLVCSQFEALVDICEAAQDDGPPPDEPTLERLFVFYDSVFLDHVAAAFQNAAQSQTRVCEVWAGSCHASVKTLADRVKRILRPDNEELRIEMREATPEETKDDTPAHRQRTYFEASIPAEAITDILARWPDLLLELKSLGMSNRAAGEFSLQQEFAQANRDARDAQLHANRAFPWGYPETEPKNSVDSLVVSSDARSVLWTEQGELFEFTALQSECFKILHRDWLKGAPVLAQHTIIDAAGVSGERLFDLFNKGKHPAWGTLIIQGGTKGAFRLAPDAPPRRNPN